MSAAAHLTVRDLLSLPTMAGAEVVGPDDCVSKSVQRIEVLEPDTALTQELRPHAVAVLCVTNPELRWTHLIELLVRRAAAARCVAVVVPRPDDPLPASLHRVTARLGVVVVLHDPARGTQALAVEAQLLVGNPDVVESRVLLDVAGRPTHQPRTSEEVIETLADALGGDAGLVDGHGARVAGEGLLTTPDRLMEVSTLDSWTADDGRAVVAMRASPVGEPAWLVVERDTPGPRWAPLARRALALVRGELLAWLTSERLESERRARVRSMLLNDIVDRPFASAEAIAAAQDIGWDLSGWHIGFHVSFTGEPRPERWELELAASGASTEGLSLHGVVERSDGWVMWSTGDAPPTPQALRRKIRHVREALEQVRGGAPERGVALGVGSPQRHPDGLARTLREAREAAVLAPSGRGSVAVRAVQDLGASQLLVGWYGSGLFQEASRQILGPLDDAGEDEVLATLAAYLERACSTAQTARALGVHRNTVLQRVTRAERLLGVSLNQPDTRLALQLALRARRHP